MNAGGWSSAFPVSSVGGTRVRESELTLGLKDMFRQHRAPVRRNRESSPKLNRASSENAVVSMWCVSRRGGNRFSLRMGVLIGEVRGRKE